MSYKEIKELPIIQDIDLYLKDLKSVTACFTGHRLQKLPWKANEQDICCLEMKEKLDFEIEKAIKSGYRYFISGMALGFDMICAEEVLKLKSKYGDIKLYAALPCGDQDLKWCDKDKKRYYEILKNADGIRCVCEKYNGKECMFERNTYMINSSSLLIALFSGRGGGTKKTIEYAKSKDLKTVIIDL